MEQSAAGAIGFRWIGFRGLTRESESQWRTSMETGAPRSSSFRSTIPDRGKMLDGFVLDGISTIREQFRMAGVHGSSLTVGVHSKTKGAASRWHSWARAGPKQLCFMSTTRPD